MLLWVRHKRGPGSIHRSDIGGEDCGETAGRSHCSGRPARRRPAATTSMNLGAAERAEFARKRAIVAPASIASSRPSSTRASARRPRCVLAAILYRRVGLKRGWSCKARPAHSIACSKREEMSDGDSTEKEKAERIERAQAQRPIARLDRRLGLVTQRVDSPSRHPGVAALGLSASARSSAAVAITVSPGK
jgi:hypothetical protein